MKNLLAKLLEAQKRIQPILKGEKNPFYGSRYFDVNAVIADVKPVLSEVGLVALQPLTIKDGKPALKTMICDPESGEMIEDTILLNENADTQKFGATVTYMRRFALTSMLLLQGEEDDDGNTATGKTKAVTKAPAKEPEQTYEQPFPDEAPKPLHEGDPCPRCEVGTMKLRKGAKGPFLGCNAFPDCKHTANV